MDDIVFIGDWVKDRVLGSGSFGTVILWKHKRTDEKLAIKTCKWGDELTKKHRERWTTEVEMLQNCNNPNIVGTKDLPPEFVIGLAQANPSKLPILCMEFCSGGDLRQLLNKPESCTGLKELCVRQILSDISNALEFLHSFKITHRDLKPENIVMHVLDNIPTDVSAQSQRKVIYKLIDLGYAKEIDSKSVCASFVGTLQYLAPEILYSKTYSNSVDFWSFGLLAFEIICGTRPFLPSMAPVQWMPHVKKKSHENISVYETHHGDIEYSNELFQENHITKPLKKMLEKWLQLALEWDPKLRGRDTPSKVTFNIPNERQNASNSETSNVILFSELKNILSKTIIKVFSVTTLSSLAYEIDNTTTILKLKQFIQKDTGILMKEQILISPTSFNNISDDELVITYYNDQQNIMLYIYSRISIINEKDNIKPIVPNAIQRCLGNPNALYNFKNSQTLYKHGVYFVISQMQIYESFVNGLQVRAESLKSDSRQLLLIHNDVDKNIGKLMTQEETLAKFIDTGKKHIENLRTLGTGVNYLGGFDRILKDADDLTDKIDKLQSAWNHVSVRLTSATRKSSEVMSADFKNFITKYNYQITFANAVKAYLSHKKSEFYSERKSKEKQCPDIVKVCYECLKLRSLILNEIKEQSFKIKLDDLGVQFTKIADIITNAGENTEKLTTELTRVFNELTNCMWTTISVLSSNTDQLSELPYNIASYEKRNFKIGDAVNNRHGNLNILENNEVKSIIEESLHIRQNNLNLTKKLNSSKKVFQDIQLDFSFLNDK